MKTLISDMGGVIYSYDSQFDPAKHLEAFDIAMKKMGLENSDLNSMLAGEYHAIKNGDLITYPIKSGIDNLKENQKIYKVVVISMAPANTSKYILQNFGVDTSNIDFYNMADYGSKKDKESWKTIFKKYDSIDSIVEDGEANLKAANQAALNLGFSPKTFISMPNLAII
ncbi:hypothetical protein CO009_00630 [Candidatus Shapirobacteria bacterium CG_4_8_14_3_um_filter_35_11]|uniref:Haloacid dehalogenase n=3 Tax=Candidatus Shapironibacteriota TaxID=1752721 RepID=A0A2M8L1B7_9BACT|nr:MAG: hypothetical protein CO009_00630 [Candidatus Shapirobacteria bacterium CG_4_8_14_3_um_filter_35_11]PJE66725.1 MAG: hypothetical protein COU93_02745 [Candidatus Shapirobacteria bacterium CG10_big_fil_rev_8_21_14_0_10_36_6]